TSFRYAFGRLFPPLKVGLKLWTSLGLLTGYGLLVGVVVDLEHLAHVEWGAESTVLNGLVLGFLISFRNNSAYDRWWDARKLWGQLINESRNLCLKIRALNGVEPVERATIGRLVNAFSVALMNHLRRPDGSDEPPRGSVPPKEQVNEPVRLAGELYE